MPADVQQPTERYACIKPANSRWNDGWLLHMTTIGGWVMVQHPGQFPFVLTSEAWNMLPDRRTPYAG